MSAEVLFDASSSVVAVVAAAAAEEKTAFSGFVFLAEGSSGRDKSCCCYWYSSVAVVAAVETVAEGPTTAEVRQAFGTVFRFLPGACSLSFQQYLVLGSTPAVRSVTADSVGAGQPG